MRKRNSAEEPRQIKAQEVLSAQVEFAPYSTGGLEIASTKTVIFGG
jgi:hypothetical protein